jgi:tRNA modification GTPase
MRLDSFYLSSHILLQVIEGVEVYRLHRARARLFLQLVAQSFVLEGQHSAVGVVDDDELLRAQEVMRNDERPQRILCRDPACVTDNVCLARLESTNLFDRDSGVHTSQDGELARRRHREMAEFEIAGVGFISKQHFIGDGHGFSLRIVLQEYKGTLRGGTTSICTRLRLLLSPGFSRYNLPVNLDDTIVAIATPPGRGGIGVVRLAGPEARSIAAPMLELKHELEPGRAAFGELIEPCGAGALARSQIGTDSEPHVSSTEQNQRAGALAPHRHEQRIDEVVVTYFAKPHSYTTDDIVEISAHGSPVVLRHVVELALARGARLAEPGEFTMRAFLNGRIDLTQAEAVRDLIESQTLYQAKVAAQQLEGALSRRLQPIKQKLVELIAVLEAGIDFAEDDVSVLPAEQILEHISAVRTPLQELSDSFAYGKLVHEGLTLAIVGRPNVGKSSLFNRMVESDRAIVTATPGTTRDLVTETVAIDGIPLRLVDTAGIRSALDEAEGIGIRKSMEALVDADLVLLVLDSSEPAEDEDLRLLALVANRTAIVVENKSDKTSSQFQVPSSQLHGVRVSALTGEGISELRAEILRQVGGEFEGRGETGFLTNTRHQGLVRDSLAGLDASAVAVHGKVPHEMVLLDLYSALGPLDEITGATTNDDILNLIFRKFCIGK